jgi:asparagine synthase (glutamine-hydrolysing)
MLPELPANILDRVKQPYMAPDSNSFVQDDSPEYVDEMLSEEVLDRYGVFNAKAVGKLRQKCTRLADKHLSFKDNMSFISILSTQLLIHQYIENFSTAEPLKRSDFKVWHDATTA